MASEERNFPPSDLKLEQLRKGGIVPFSAELMTFGACLALFFCVSGLAVLFGPRIIDLLTSAVSVPARERLQGSHLPDNLPVLLGGGLLFTAGTAALTLFLAGALQTRFLVTFGTLGFDFARLLRPAPLAGAGGRLISAALRLALALLALTASFLVIRYLLVEAAADYRDAVSEDRLIAESRAEPALSAAPAGMLSGKQAIARQRLVTGLALFRGAVTTLLMPILVGTLFIGVLSRLGAVISFNRSHRMSRAEAEAEARETEPSPQMRQARRSISASDD